MVSRLRTQSFSFIELTEPFALLTLRTPHQHSTRNNAEVVAEVERKDMSKQLVQSYRYRSHLLTMNARMREKLRELEKANEKEANMYGDNRVVV
ncbi:hypothetical protein KC360_g117 [Hortaea werneckii]|nr:hypothetical protein KC344_g118 [Hortaea werneckii]KAI7180536.1 hypothetical protein KC360_g117 [Hortaea werneckii]